MVAAAEIGEQLAVHHDPVIATGRAEAVTATNVHTEQFGARSFGHAGSSSDEMLGRRCAGDRNHQSFAGFPGALDPVFVAVLEQFVVDPVRDPEQGQLAQRAQVARPEVVAERRIDSFRGVDVAVRDPPPKRLGRHVDELDLVGRGERRHPGSSRVAPRR